MNSLRLLFILTLCIPGTLNAQNSVNIYGNVSESNKTYRIQANDSGYFAFGNYDLLTIQYFDFVKGRQWAMAFKEKNGTSIINLYGKGGILENDSVFLVLGRIGTTNTGIIKATKSGRIIWAKWYNTGTDEHPDKIVKLKNGDYLVSVRTNVSYYEFGEWGSRAGVFRISPDGNLKWFRLLDYRSANTSSVVRGMFETDGGNIIVTQSYDSKLGLIKLSGNGDSLKSHVSSADFVLADADYDTKNQKIILVSSDKKVCAVDTSFSVIFTKTITNTNLNSLSSVAIINDTIILLGGKYNNDACILYCDYQFNVLACHYKRFTPSTASTLLGLFKDGQEGLSMIYPGIAVTKHNLPNSPLCFNKVNGSQFTTNSSTNPSFNPHVKIQGLATSDDWENIIALKTYHDFSSANCLGNDISVQPDKVLHTSTCPDFTIKLYITNQGVNNLTRFSIRYYVNGKAFDTTIILTSAIGSKSSSFVNIANIYLRNSGNIICGKTYNPNNAEDEFKWNDSFSMEVQTRPYQILKLDGVDSLCEGSTSVISCNGKAGTYDWYKNGTVVKQGTSQILDVNSAGSYHARLTDSVCYYYSDTLKVTIVPKPVKPLISKNEDKLNCNATGKFIWYYNNNPKDTSKTEITPYGYGTYFVRAYNDFGCFSESDHFILKDNSINPSDLFNNLQITENKHIVFTGNEAVQLKIFSSDGKLLLESRSGENKLSVELPKNIYLLQIINQERARVVKLVLGE